MKNTGVRFKYHLLSCKMITKGFFQQIITFKLFEFHYRLLFILADSYLTDGFSIT